MERMVRRFTRVRPRKRIARIATTFSCNNRSAAATTAATATATATTAAAAIRSAWAVVPQTVVATTVDASHPTLVAAPVVAFTSNASRPALVPQTTGVSAAATATAAPRSATSNHAAVVLRLHSHNVRTCMVPS